MNSRYGGISRVVGHGLWAALLVLASAQIGSRRTGDGLFFRLDHRRRPLSHAARRDCQRQLVFGHADLRFRGPGRTRCIRWYGAGVCWFGLWILADHRGPGVCPARNEQLTSQFCRRCACESFAGVEFAVAAWRRFGLFEHAQLFFAGTERANLQGSDFFESLFLSLYDPSGQLFSLDRLADGLTYHPGQSLEFQLGAYIPMATGIWPPRPPRGFSILGHIDNIYTMPGGSSVSTLASTVPEPSSLVLLCCGLAGIAGMRVRRRLSLRPLHTLR